jgi:hypothetical protein
MEKFRQRSTVPDEAEDVDWDAPPPYELFVGDDNCNVSTAVQGNSHSMPAMLLQCLRRCDV